MKRIRRGAKIRNSSPLSLVTVTSAGLIVTLTQIGYTLGLLFIVFALSLFGMYEITLPNFLLRGAEAGRKKGGLLGKKD